MALRYANPSDDASGPRRRAGRVTGQTRTVRPSRHPCAGHERFETREEFEDVCENIRPWPDFDMDIGECRRCASTLAFKEDPPPQENPAEKTFADLQEWLDEAVPVLVHNQMLCARAVKVCSGISPMFAKASQERGFDAYIYRLPRHVVVAIQVVEGWYKIDLSYIQFELPALAEEIAAADDDPKDRWGEYRALRVLLARVEQDPFAAIDVEKLEYEPSNLEDPSAYEFDFDRAKEMSKFKSNPARTRNPKTGKTAPDLFGESTPVFVPLEDLDHDQIVALPRNAFSIDEWNELDEDTQEDIYENDEASEARVQALVDVFVQPIEWVQNADADYIKEYVGRDGLSGWLMEDRDHHVDNILRHHRGRNRDEVEEILNTEWDPPVAPEAVKAALEEALADEDNWDDGEVTNQYAGGYVYLDGSTEDQVSVEQDQWLAAMEGMFPDEIDRALEKVNKETGNAFGHYGRGKRAGLSKEYLTQRYSVEAHVSVDYYVGFNPYWDAIKRALGEALNVEFDVDEEVKSAGDAIEKQERVWADHDARIVYRFPDQSYVLELTPDEMKEEGQIQGFCIGKEEFGYPRAVRRGEGKAFSLRTPSGRPKITLFAEMEKPGSDVVRSVSQAKGKANRLVGWDLGKAGQGKVKEDEVKKTAEFVVEKLKVDPMQVEELEPGLHAVIKADPSFGKTLNEKRVAAGFAPAVWTKLSTKLSRNPARSGGARPHGKRCDHGQCEGFCVPYRRSTVGAR